MTAAGLHLDALRLDYQGQFPELASRTVEIQSLLESAMVQVREVSTDLHPAMVRRLGIRKAIERLAEQARERGLMASFSMPADLRVQDPPASVFHAIAVRTLAYAEYRGAQTIVFDVFQDTGAYVLEVLYDVASPNHLEFLNSLGLAVSVSAESCGKTLIRAQYSHAIRGSAG